MKINNSQKGFVVQGIVALVALLVIGGVALYLGKDKIDINDPTLQIAKDAYVNSSAHEVNLDCLVFKGKNEIEFTTYSISLNSKCRDADKPISDVLYPTIQVNNQTLEVLIDGKAYASSEWKTRKNTKTYKNIKDGYTFEYPTKLSLSTSTDGVNLTHSIPFENTDGGCDMVGNAKVSKTLGDFNVLISVASGQIKPPYVDGTFSGGSLKGDWAYMGAEGCGQTVYYFPISGNRTLIVTKQELQVLSPVVAPEVRNKVLAVPGVISYEESNTILKEILSTFKFTK